MNRKNKLLLIIIALILSSCSIQQTQIASVTTSTVNALPTRTAEPTMTPQGMPKNDTPTITISLTPLPRISAIPIPILTSTPTEIPIPPPEAKLEFRCLKEMAEPEKGVYTGTIVLGGFIPNPSYLFDLSTWEMKLLDDDQIGHSSSYETISPDRTWLAYKKYLNDVLVVRTVDNEKKMEIVWEPDWFMIEGWLGNENLLISLQGSAYLKLNPFTGERLMLPNDFSDFQEAIGIGADYWDPIYNLDITRVVYPAIADRIVLWDMQTQRPITTLVSGGGQPFGGYKPVWSPDGTKFMISYQPAALNLDTFHDELYVVTEDGKEIRVTNLGEYYTERLQTSGYSWSPDGTKVAFWSTHQLNQNEERKQQFAILDMTDMQVTEYCISGTIYGTSQSPVWSPNGKQIAVQGFFDSNSNGNQGNWDLLLIDLDKGVFYPIIGEDYRLGGWLK